jgi:hypothetical protein
MTEATANDQKKTKDKYWASQGRGSRKTALSMLVGAS